MPRHCLTIAVLLALASRAAAERVADHATAAAQAQRWVWAHYCRHVLLDVVDGAVGEATSTVDKVFASDLAKSRALRHLSRAFCLDDGGGLAPNAVVPDKDPQASLSALRARHGPYGRMAAAMAPRTRPVHVCDSRA